MTSEPGRLRGVLVLAAAGAVLVLLGFLGTIAELVGVGLVALAALLTAEQGAGWRRMLVLGAVFCAVGVPLSLLLETIGGLLAGIGGALVIIAVAFGWPSANAGSVAPPGPPTTPPQAPPAP
ncbi:MAG: hypothetical protein ACXWES_05670 [Solirubrobacterales bacterium]